MTRAIKNRISLLLNPAYRNHVLLNKCYENNLSEILIKYDEMVFIANTPKAAKGKKEEGDQGGSGGKKVFVSIKCSYDGCDYTAKYKKIVRQHEESAHGKAGVSSAETSTESTESNSESNLENNEADNVSTINAEVQIHQSMDQRAHSTQVDQITQDLQYNPVTTYGASSSSAGEKEKLKRKRKDEKDSDDEDDDRKKAREDSDEEEGEEEEGLTPASQSPEAIERRRRMAETKLFLKAKQAEVARERIAGILNEDEEEDSNEEEKMEQSSNLLVEEREGNSADSLDLTNHP